jgi:hypothetical protein
VTEVHAFAANALVATGVVTDPRHHQPQAWSTRPACGRRKPMTTASRENGRSACPTALAQRAAFPHVIGVLSSFAEDDHGLPDYTKWQIVSPPGYREVINVLADAAALVIIEMWLT